MFNAYTHTHRTHKCNLAHHAGVEAYFRFDQTFTARERLSPKSIELAGPRWTFAWFVLIAMCVATVYGGIKQNNSRSNSAKTKAREKKTSEKCSLW